MILIENIRDLRLDQAFLSHTQCLFAGNPEAHTRGMRDFAAPFRLKNAGNLLWMQANNADFGGLTPSKGVTCLCPQPCPSVLYEPHFISGFSACNLGRQKEFAGNLCRRHQNPHLSTTHSGRRDGSDSRP